ncbi:STAS/SEC14 domain-containing protein [Eisenibacter elegans]|jgi:hypothetical protein|uniref:STAS/SEC14 domain-containing protein n=1 Tax=Eisenibacter elegans TaxID=997 RepID=UPI000406457B|nr:STAS/SEC14 domain-containing protein [Eisenibacter elegans]
MSIYQTLNTIIWHDEGAKRLRLVWRGVIQGADYREGLHRLLSLSLEREAQNWLIDQRERTGMALPTDIQWLTQEFIPLAAAMLGAQLRMAVLRSTSLESHQHETVIQQGLKLIDKPPTIAFFDTEAEAVQWLGG